MSELLLLLASVCVLAVLLQWLAWRLQIPAILPLLLLGILLGPVTGWLQPDELFGDLLFPMVSLAVAVILFEGALGLNFADLKGHGASVTRLISVGLLVTFVLTAVASHWLLDMSWSLALLVGAILVVTGPTVIMPLLRVARPTQNIFQILRWEGILIDPLGAILAVLVFEAVVLSSHHDAVSFSLLLVLVKMVLVGLAAGIAGGWLFALALKHNWLPRWLNNFAMLSAVIFVMALADYLAHEAGLLAVTVMGIWLANYGELELEDLVEFKENLALILLSVVFVLLAARLDFSGLMALGWPLLALFVFLQCVVRPVSVLLSTMGQGLRLTERMALGWIAPRGIVAAAVSSLFALRLADQGMAGADAVVAVVFAMILGTVILQSLTARPVLQLLGERREAVNGVLIVGANPVAQALGLALKEQGVPVDVIDSDLDNYRRARMAGLVAHYGFAQSEQAAKVIELDNLKLVLALSSDHFHNALAVYHYSGLLGERKVFTWLASSAASRARWGSALFHRRQLLFADGEASFTDLQQKLEDGWRVSTFALNGPEDWHALQVRYAVGMIPLVALPTDSQRVQPFAKGSSAPDLPGIVIALVHPVQ